MANIVTGVVEVVMPNKFDKEKITIKVEGDDRWFNQKREFLDVVPNRGDKVSFSSGKEEGQKYIQGLRILESSAPAPAKGKAGGGFNALGVELGHAANNAVQMLTAGGKVPSLTDVEELTIEFYHMMASIREKIGNEADKVEETPVKKAKPEAAKDEEFDDDFPF